MSAAKRTREDIRELISSKRIAAFDYGAKRVGWAVCDEFHITISTKGVLPRKEANFWDLLIEGLQKERIGCIIVGVPLRVDGDITKLIKEIRKFIVELKRRSGLEVLEVDEAFSSKRAVETMVEIGVKKGQRRDKGRKDEIAAAIMLRDFLTENEL